MSTKQISTKKLKAIVFTDIVGFTKISAEDEQHALDIIDKQRELLHYQLCIHYWYYLCCMEK